MLSENCSVDIGKLANSSLPCKQEHLDESRMWDLIGAAYIALVTLAAIIGNGALCWIILKNPSLQTVSNRLVLNLACCDLLTAILNAPFTLAVLVYKEWTMGRFMCVVNGFLTTSLGIASVVTLAAISVNRYYMIVHASKCSQVFTPVTTRAVIAGVWMFSTLCGLPPVFGWSHYTFIPGKAICTLSWSTDVSYTLTVLALGVALPFALMLVSYYKIVIAVRNSKRRIHVMVNGRVAPGGKDQAFQKVASLAVAIASIQQGRTSQVGHRRMTSGPPIGLLSETESNAATPDASPTMRRKLLSKSVTKKMVASGLSVPVSVTVEDVSSSTEDLVSTQRNLPLSQRSPSRSTPSRKSSKGCALSGEMARSLAVFQTANSELGPQGRHCRRRSSLETPACPVWHLADSPETMPDYVPPPFKRVRRLSLDLAPDCSTGGVNKRAHAQVLSVAALSAPASRCQSQESLNSDQNGDLSAKVTNLPLSGSTVAKASSLTNLLADSEARNVVDASQQKRSRRSDDLRVTFTIFLVIVVFVACWAPISIVNCVETFSGYQITVTLDRFTISMVFLQSALNPVIYGVRNRNFRQGFRRLFCCLCVGGQASSSNKLPR